MGVRPEVRAFVEAHDWSGLLGYEWVIIGPRGQLLAVGVVLLLLVLGFGIIWLGAAAARNASSLAPLPERALAPVNTRGRKPSGPAYIPLVLGPVTVDLQPGIHDTMHVIVSGTSRMGKSTTVASLMDLDIGFLCFALDNSRPIATRVRQLPNGVEWTNDRDWSVGLDLLRGAIPLVAEGLVAGWAAKTAGDTGKYRGIAQDRLEQAIERLDDARVRRNIPDLAVMLSERTNDSEADRACRDWAGRMLRLERALGSSLGHDLDLVEAMERRQKVVCRVNRFLYPQLAPMIGGMLLVHGRRAAQVCKVPFVLVIEEAGQLGQFQAEMAPLAQAGADRGVPLIVITQNPSKLPLEVRNNVKVHVSFAHEDLAEQREVAQKLRLDPAHLQVENFPGKGEKQGVGWAYVRAPGVATTLVHIKQQRPASAALGGRVSAADTIPSEIRTVENGHAERTGQRRIEIIELKRDRLPELPPPSADMTGLMADIYRDGECERWKGKHDRAGHKKECPKDCADQKHLDNCYGLVWWPLETPRWDEKRQRWITAEWQRIHRVRWERAYGSLPIDPETGKKVTLDHMRTCRGKDCSKFTHLEPCSGSENSKRRWRVRGVAAD